MTANVMLTRREFLQVVSLMSVTPPLYRRELFKVAKNRGSLAAWSIPWSVAKTPSMMRVKTRRQLFMPLVMNVKK